MAITPRDVYINGYHSGGPAPAEPLMPAYVELAESFAVEDQQETNTEDPACEVKDTGAVGQEAPTDA